MRAEMRGPLACSRHRAIFPFGKRSANAAAHWAMASGVWARVELSRWPVVQSYRQRACSWLPQSSPMRATKSPSGSVLFILWLSLLVNFILLVGSFWLAARGANNTLASIRRRHYCLDLERVLHLRIRDE